MSTMTSTWHANAIPAPTVAHWRAGGLDDAGRPPLRFTDADGDSQVRCCLRHSEPGENLLLVSYAPLRRWAAQTGADPGAFDEVGPIYVHADDCHGHDDGAYPAALRGQPRVFRVYGPDGRIIGGKHVAASEDPEPVIERLLAEADAALVHVRNVVYGCFAFEIRRTDAIDG